MSFTSGRQPASDTPSPRVPSWIARWRLWVPWIGCGLCLILLLRMDFVISRLRRQLTTSQTDQQRTRRMTATLLWSQIADVAHDLERAQSAAARNDLSALTTSLGDAQQHAYDADDTADLYQAILVGDHAGQAFGLADTILVLYGNAAANLSSMMNRHATVSPQDQALLTVLQADIALMQTSFPEDLLATAPSERLDQAMITFCRTRHSPSVLEQINGADLTALTVCRSR
jgi:hypothetical protein